MKKIKISLVLKIVSTSLLALVLLQGAYLALEPAAVGAVTDEVVVTLVVDAGITISDGGNVTMAPNLGLISNSSIGSSLWTVVTNDTDGYTLAVKASASPALVSATSSIADYTETVNGTPEAWSIASGAKEFGFSAHGTDTDTVAWGTAASCGAAGVPDASQKYVGFKTTDKQIATRNAITPIAGVNTSICFAAAQNGVFADSGTYTATITATALVQ
ncbi:MAG TPA: hypothetical protein VFQ59_00080 [Candidatus Paceibacterota bacterium]|nr:hypothetical protein [Candidatus Paceibacterota bacterium]